MRDAGRIEPTLAAIKAYWEKHPDTRLGQLLSNVSYAVNPSWHGDPFYMEDHDLVAHLWDQG